MRDARQRAEEQPVKVLVLGGAGMLGHKVFERLRGRFDVYVTFREPAARDRPMGL